MSGLILGLTAFVAMLGLIALRMPVGLAMLVVGSVGYTHLTSGAIFLNYLKSTPYHLFSNYTLSVIALFILMGAFAERGGQSRNLFLAAAAMVGKVRGGMAMAVIWAATIFAAICGSSVATTATFGRAVLPELKRYKYSNALATGTIAISGVIGILIPPSIILVVYAISTEQNIVKLFSAALIPGLLASVFYTIAIAWTVRRDPAAGPVQEIQLQGPERRRVLLRVWGFMGVVLLVLGGIYAGIFTPTEGAAVGTMATFLLALSQRELNWDSIKTCLLQTGETAAMIFAILLGAEVFNAFLALTQLPMQLADTIAGSGLPPYGVMVLLLVAYLVLGAVMDELAMILLTLPIFFPVVMALDFGMPPDDVAIWFGILVLVVVGIGLTAPPIGMNVFVVSAIAKDVPIATTYRGVLPFIAVDIVRLALLTAFPVISLWLMRLLD
ncbi:TRAP transporter large permease [Ferrovibrio sp.]|uniref:TRAP transporter large permease n=1 Tax=Ferrovibrio sp. TaxID=1917215 RepID=UPI003D0CC7F1